MVINPIKGFLFAAGAAAAIVAIAWYAGGLDPYLPGEPPVIAAAPDPAATPPSAKGERVGEPDPVEVPAPAPAEAPAVAATAEVVPPSFDLVRVEPDGSIVIAGRAAGDATVEIIAGSEVVGSAKAGPGGDFAAVLDEPLEPGDYQIVLRSTAPDDVVAASPETAIVSIPEQPDGQVLALVEQPGEPSRLITVPEAETPDAPAQPEAGAGGEEQTPAASEIPGAPEADSGNIPATPGQETAAARASGHNATASEEAAPADIAGAPEGAAGQPERETATAPSTVAPAAEQPQTGPSELAAVAPGAGSAPAAAQQPAGMPVVAVEAVEIEGPQVFVAGRAEPGTTVRVYANDMLLGDSQVSAGGRFLVETERELPVGDYIIRADVLSDNGAEVMARAAVPFEREPGESIAAVAPSASSVDAGNTAERQAAARPVPAEERRTAPPAIEEPASTAPAQPAEEGENRVAAAPVQEPTATGPTGQARSPQAAADQEPDTDTAAAPPKSEPDSAAEAEATTSAPADEDAAAPERESAALRSQESAGPPARESAATAPTVSAPPSAAAPATPPVVVEAPDAATEIPEVAAEAASKPAADAEPSGSASASDSREMPSAEPVETAQAGQGVPADLSGSAGAGQDSAPARPAEIVEAEEDSADAEPAPEEQVAAAAPAAPDQSPSAVAPADDVPTITAPKLESVPSAVIIRRGDNLWRISRRVYGRGIRYTTIYMANEQQIQDPDLIFPGQVFSVPERTEEGETADMDVIRERLTRGREAAAQ